MRRTFDSSRGEKLLFLRKQEREKKEAFATDAGGWENLLRAIDRNLDFEEFEQKATKLTKEEKSEFPFLLEDQVFQA